MDARAMLERLEATSEDDILGPAEVWWLLAMAREAMAWREYNDQERGGTEHADVAKAGRAVVNACITSDRLLEELEAR